MSSHPYASPFVLIQSSLCLPIHAKSPHLCGNLLSRPKERYCLTKNSIIFCNISPFERPLCCATRPQLIHALRSHSCQSLPLQHSFRLWQLVRSVQRVTEATNTNRSHLIVFTQR